MSRGKEPHPLPIIVRHEEATAGGVLNAAADGRIWFTPSPICLDIHWLLAFMVEVEPIEPK